MSIGAVITMIVILSIVWGGFIFTLRMAVRKEAQKEQSAE